jgi:hypothetical protein
MYVLNLWRGSTDTKYLFLNCVHGTRYALASIDTNTYSRSPKHLPKLPTPPCITRHRRHKHETCHTGLLVAKHLERLVSCRTAMCNKCMSHPPHALPSKSRRRGAVRPRAQKHTCCSLSSVSSSSRPLPISEPCSVSLHHACNKRAIFIFAHLHVCACICMCQCVCAFSTLYASEA